MDASQVQTRCRQNVGGEGPLSKAPNPQLLYKTTSLRFNPLTKQFGTFSTLFLCQ